VGYFGGTEHEVWKIISCTNSTLKVEHLFSTTYCINTIQSSPQTSELSAEKLATIHQLFEQNNLDYSNLQFYSLNQDLPNSTIVKCHQYVNNLLLFTNDLVFGFGVNGVFNFHLNESVSTINLDTQPSMNQNDVVWKFIQAADEHYSADEPPYLGDFDIEVFSNNCFDLEFGYYDLNLNGSHTEHNFTKAWLISVSDSGYPLAYINDTTWEVIYFDDGIRY
jgi:hypothetical protein